MKLAMLPIVAATLCSREGWAIGEGLAMLYKWVFIGIMTVFAVALLSGIVFGARKGRHAFWRQIGLHLIGAAVFLVVAPIIGLGIWEIRRAQVHADVERNRAIVDAWMAPLQNPVPGELDRGLAAVMEAEIAKAPGRRGYLIVALPELFGRIDFGLNDNERVAVLVAAQRLRLDNAQLGIGSHPANLERLDGTVAWLIEKPDLPSALQVCAERRDCKSAVLEFAEKWCRRKWAECRSAFNAERLNAAEALVRGDQSAAWRLKEIQQRIKADSPPGAG